MADQPHASPADLEALEDAEALARWIYWRTCCVGPGGRACRTLAALAPMWCQLPLTAQDAYRTLADEIMAGAWRADAVKVKAHG